MLDTITNNFLTLDIDKLRPVGFFEKFSSFKQSDISRVTAGSGWEIRDSCPVCGSGQRRTEFNCGGIAILGCGECSHRYTEKVPVDPDEVYDSEAYSNAVETLELEHKDYRAERFGTSWMEAMHAQFSRFSSEASRRFSGDRPEGTARTRRPRPEARSLRPLAWRWLLRHDRAHQLR